MKRKNCQESSGKKKKTIEDWNRLTAEEKKELPPEELEELFEVLEEWFEREAPKLCQKSQADLQAALSRLADLDAFLAEKGDEIDILFLTQSQYLKKRDFVEQVKQDLQFYVRCFNAGLSDEELERLWNKISAIEVRYKEILADL